MTFPTYLIASETASGVVCADSLHREVVDAGPYTYDFEGLFTDDGTLTTMFSSDLPSEEKTTVDGVVSAHTGAPFYQTVFIESDQILANGISVTEDSAWEELGGQPTNVQSLLVCSGFEPSDLRYVVGRIVCEVKVSGDGAQLAIHEQQGGEEKVLGGPYDIADTEGEWVITKILTTVIPSTGDATYCFEGRLNGATSMEVRRAAVTVLYVGP